MDLHASRDGELIVFHDDTVEVFAEFQTSHIRINI
ncbi:MAG: hypothetical protein PHP79_03190 [Clostridia bacterium]|nr:hypothetical protein [Clostridia bacterium]